MIAHGGGGGSSGGAYGIPQAISGGSSGGGSSGSYGMWQVMPSTSTNGLPSGGGGGQMAASSFGFTPATSAPRPPGGGGMPGFAGSGTKDFEFAAGSVIGYRWWQLDAPNLRLDPLTADRHWNPRPLIGAAGAMWMPGVNHAVCKYVDEHKPPVEVDAAGRGCGCGFWAYWQPQEHDLGRNSLPVLGVIEGTGRTLIGPRGFRSQKARIIALHLPFQIVPEVRRAGWYDAFSEPEAVSVSEAELDRSAAWMAVIEDRLAQMYPDARIFSERKALIAAYPPDPEYCPPPEPPPFHWRFI